MQRRIAPVALTALAAGLTGLVLGNFRANQSTVEAAAPAPQAPASDKLRIIVFGAHPDDAEFMTAGVAMKWARLGHDVKFVSTTNGDIGHWQMAGGPLAHRRTREVIEVARRLGVTTQVLDIHDGEIMPTLENRKIITRLIRDWNADVVITHRPNDYHPDHRYTSILVQDSAFMVTVPFFCPDVPALQTNPVFLYSSDRFERPNPFRPDVAVSIDDVIEPTVDALMVMVSQLHEGGANGHAGLYPEDPAGRKQREEQVRKNLLGRYAALADRFRPVLIERYGKTQGSQVRYAQAFEICEYGRRPDKEELKRIFPF